MTLAFQVTASLLQPMVGYFADIRPMPYSLAIGMVSTLIGLLVLAVAPSYPVVLIAAMLVGLGSAVFHPEASRVARMASGGRYGSGAVGVPGRRQYRPGDQPADRRPAGGDRMASVPSSGMRGWRCWPSRSCIRSAPGTSITGWRASEAMCMSSILELSRAVW